MTEGQKNVLEMMIDSAPHGLSDIVGALADIAAEKANHILTNWQDEKLAKVWLTQAKKLSTLQTKVKGDGL